MKRVLALAAGAMLGLTGCMSGTVGVTPAAGSAGGSAGSAAPSSPSTPVTPGHGSQSSGSSSGQAAEGPVNSASAKTVYFESLSSGSSEEGQAAPTGLDFLSTQALSGTPFGFYFSTPGEAVATVVYWKPVLVNGAEEAAWIQGAAGGSNELEILDTSSSLTQPELQMNVPVAQSYALFADATTPQLAGIDASGNLFVVNSSSAAEQLGKSGFGQGSQVRWVGGTAELAVTDPVSRTVSIFSSANLKSPSASFQGDGFSASPSGKTYLIFSSVNANGSPSGSAGVGQLTQVDAKTGKSHLLQAAPTAFSQARWNGETQVAFVDSGAPGSTSQVDVLALSSGQIGVQYPISGSLAADSICPSWIGGKLFFANENTQGISVIWDADGVSPGVRQFAAPMDTDQVSGQEYACPKGVSG